jgi:hypothetical protein
MKTLFISAFHSFISKNILNTDVLRSLRDDRDIRVVIFVPEHKADFFRKTYAGENVVVEGVDVARIAASKPNIVLGRLLFLMIDSHYLWYKRVERRDARPGVLAWLKYYVYGALVKVLSGSKSLNRLARAAYRRWTPKDFFAAPFEKYRPDLVFSTDVFDPFDAQLLNEAQHHGVKTLGMVRSWDNCWSKGLMPIPPDRLLVNNGIIKEEAMTLHDYPADRIAVVGLPQFDAFVKDTRVPREAFFAKIGVDPGKRLVLFAPAGTILSDTDWQLCDILARALEEGKITQPVHFFVRNHPGHPADLSRFKKNPHFTIQDPGHVFGSNLKDTELAPDDQTFLADLLFHSDVVMYVATSLGLDSAVYDKPQIMVSFDGYEKKEYTKSVARYHDEDHMRKLIATGGTRVVRDQDAWIGAINSYLDDAALDREGRKRIVEEQLYRIDGGSGERVAREIRALMPNL